MLKNCLLKLYNLKFWRNKLTIAILIFLVLVLCVIAVYSFMGNTSIEIKYQNKSNENANISNVRCVYELSDEIDLSSGKYDTCEDNFGIYKVNHSSKQYGLYTYSFDVEVEGNIISPQVSLMKTNWKTNCDVDIIFIADSATSATLSVIVNGIKISKTFEDIQKEDISLQFGP